MSAELLLPPLLIAELESVVWPRPLLPGWQFVEIQCDDPRLPNPDHQTWASKYVNEDRFLAIQAWVRRCHGGDLRRALRASPLVCCREPNHTGTHLCNGWHRLYEARRSGLGTVPIVLLADEQFRPLSSPPGTIP